MTIGSPMLKLDREIESVKMSVLHAYLFFFHLSITIASLYLKEDDDPLFMESG